MENTEHEDMNPRAPASQETVPQEIDNQESPVGAASNVKTNDGNKAPKEEKVFIMDFPRLVSMKNRMMMEGVGQFRLILNEALESGELSEALRIPVITREVNRDDIKIHDITFWKLTYSTMLVDVDLSVKLTMIGNRGDETGWMNITVTLWCDADDRFYGELYELNPTEDVEERDLIKLDSYLTPYLGKSSVDDRSEDQWQMMHPEALIDAKQRTASILAEKYELKVVQLPIARRKRLSYLIYFEDGKAEIQELPKRGCKTVPPASIVDVPAKTIVINTNCKKDNFDLRIYQACFEYEWYYLFYRLNGSVTNDKTQFTTYKRKSMISNERASGNPLIWIPRMCNKGGLALMMPKSIMDDKVHREYQIASAQSNVPGGYFNHSGFRLQQVICNIAKEYDLKRYLVRRRIVSLGNIAAKGSCNYDPEREVYNVPFAFDTSDENRNHDYSIRRKTMLRLFCRDAAFRELMHGGMFGYVDGLLCLNDREYIEHKTGWTVLRSSSNRNVSACCLRYCYTYTDTTFKVMLDQSIFEDSEAYGFVDNYRDMKQRYDRYRAETLEALPESLKDTLSFLMKRAKMNESQLAARSGLRVQTVMEYLSGKNTQTIQNDLMLLCIAMRLPGWLSEIVLEKANLPIDWKDKNNFLLCFILDCLFLDSGKTIQKFLSQDLKKALRSRDEDDDEDEESDAEDEDDYDISA